MKINQKGFSAVEAGIVIVVLGLLVFTGWYVVKQNNKDEKTKDTAAQNQNDKDTDAKTDEQKPDPYAGWKSAQLTYEKINYKYPADWSQSVKSTPTGTTGTVKTGSDELILTGPKSNLQVKIRTGMDGVGSAVGDVILDSTAITTLGDQYYLNFYNSGEPNDTKAFGACIDLTKTVADKLEGKNVMTMNGKATYMLVCMQYPRDSNDGIVAKTPAEFKSDPSFTEARAIIESLAY